MIEDGRTLFPKFETLIFLLLMIQAYEHCVECVVEATLIKIPQLLDYAYINGFIFYIIL